MFVNIRSRTQIVRHVRAGITLDADALRVGDDVAQPTYIEAVYRFDSLGLKPDHEVVVTVNLLRRNGTVSDRSVPVSWPVGHPEMPEWAARFLRAHEPDPMGLF